MNNHFAIAFVALTAFSAGHAAENLFRFGTFDCTDAEIGKEIRYGPFTADHGGKFDVYTEDITWNKCGRLTSSPAYEEMRAGEKLKKTSVDVIFAGPGGNGIPVEADRFYDYSFELKGDTKRVRLNIHEYCNEGGKIIRRIGERDLRFVPGKEWRRFQGRYRTSPTAVRIEFQFIIWTFLDAPKMFCNDFFKPGDHVLIDNFSIVRDDRRDKLETLLKNAREPFRVAPYPVEADATCPFLPIELANPPEKIVFRAAVNEIKPLPVAVANLTETFAQYRVSLEAALPGVPSRDPLYDSGKFGLAGYPQDRISVREALRVKDCEDSPATMRLDPLAGMNEASVVSVPPGEAGSVWFDFSTYGVKPGTYRGNLRVVSLGEGAKYRFKVGRYYDMVSKEKIVPVEFTVDPITLPRESVRPAHMCSPCVSEQAFGFESSVGVRFYNINTRFFRPEAVGNPASKARKAIADYRGWAARRGVDIVFFVKYDALGVSQQIFNPGNDPARKWTAWEDYVRTVAKIMEEAGVAFGDYYVLLKDEPANADLPELLEGQKRLKRLFPEMRTYISACPRIEGKIDYLEFMGGTTDLWALTGDLCERPGTVDRLRSVKAKYGSKLLHYRCSTSIREPLSGYYRRHCWRGEQMGLDGDMMYRFSRHANGTYGELGFKVVPYGEIVYSAGERMMPSVRYMAYREGVTDIKYMQTLREMRGDEPEIAAFLKKAAERVVCGDPVSPGLPGEVREEIRRLLMEGKKPRR